MHALLFCTLFLRHSDDVARENPARREVASLVSPLCSPDHLSFIPSPLPPAALLRGQRGGFRLSSSSWAGSRPIPASSLEPQECLTDLRKRAEVVRDPGRIDNSCSNFLGLDAELELQFIAGNATRQLEKVRYFPRFPSSVRRIRRFGMFGKDENPQKTSQGNSLRDRKSTIDSIVLQGRSFIIKNSSTCGEYPLRRTHSLAIDNGDNGKLDVQLIFGSRIERKRRRRGDQRSSSPRLRPWTRRIPRRRSGYGGTYIRISSKKC